MDSSTPNDRALSDWGSDTLADFIDNAHHNILASYANLRAQYDVLVEIDGLFHQMIENLNQSPEFVSGFFLFRTHSSFLAAARLALSGQLGEAYMVLRGCLESSLYGLYVSNNTNRQETWLRRHEDEASLRRMRNEFTIRKVMTHLQSVDAQTQQIVQKLYEDTIDYGGHPNERAISTQVSTEQQGSQVTFRARYLICNELAHQVCVRGMTQIGICCLDIFYYVFPQRYRILGIDLHLNQIRQGF